jgi:hypothetical protein
MGPELEKDVESYRSFIRSSKRLVEVNAQSCQLRPNPNDHRRVGAVEKN